MSNQLGDSRKFGCHKGAVIFTDLLFQLMVNMFNRLKQKK